MCHQTVGLIARQLEAACIPTVCLSSARDITAAVNPPRAAFVDFPLGHTAGRVHQPDLNRHIVGDALALFHSADRPGVIVDLPYRWADDDDWKDGVMRPAATPDADGGAGPTDDRVERFDSPQYQSAQDARAAAHAHPDDSCRVCAGIDY